MAKIKSLLSLVDNPLQDYGVPSRFSGGVRGGMRKTVGDAATDRIGRYRDLSRQYQSASGSNQKNEVVDLIADDIVRAAIESDPSKPGAERTILADFAAGLSDLSQTDPQLFDRAMRKAYSNDPSGRVEIFESLREPLEAPISQKADRKANKAARETEDVYFSQDQIPEEARVSSVMRDLVATKGKKKGQPLEDTNRSYKNYKKSGKLKLSEDLEKQFRAINKKYGKVKFDETPRTRMTPEQSAKQDAANVAKLPPVVGPKEGNVDLYLQGGGTKTGSGFSAPNAQRFDETDITVDTKAETTTRTESERLVSDLYRLSGVPQSTLSPNQLGNRFSTLNDGEMDAASLQGGWAASEEELATFLDRRIPEWRGRYQRVRPDGTVEYPLIAPSSRFLSNLIASLHQPKDATFAKRIEPLIQKLIDAAPEAPPPGSRAEWFSQHPFSLGEEFRSETLGITKQGQKPKIAHEIYDDRMLPKKMKGPEVTPQKGDFFEASDGGSVEYDNTGGRKKLSDLIEEPVEQEFELGGNDINMDFTAIPGLMNQVAINRPVQESPLRRLI